MPWFFIFTGFIMGKERSFIDKLREKFLIEKDHKLKGFPLITTLLLCGITLVMAYFLFKPKSHKSTTLAIDNIADKFVYKTTVVRYTELEGQSEFPGKVSFDENRIVKVFSIVSGKVEGVNVSLGSYVQKGDELAKIKSTDISEYRKEYKVSKANYEIALKKLKVAEGLFKSKFASELDVINARKEFNKTKDELKKSEDVLKIFETDPNKNFPYYSLKAPIEGFIVEKNINNNTLIRPDNASTLFTISDLKTVWVYTNIFESDIANIQEGQEVEIETPAFPEMKLKSRVSNVSRILNATTKAVQIRIEIDNPLGRLRPEMLTKIKIDLPDSEKKLTVPPDAIIFDNGHYYVVGLTNKKFKVIKVEILRKTTDHSFIQSGIGEGDTVVTQGSLLLYNQIVNKL